MAKTFDLLFGFFGKASQHVQQKNLGDQLGPTRSHQGGNGGGLAVSRDMIEALDGEIELTPAPAGGTRATVRVPTLLIPEAPKSKLKEVEHATA